MRKGFTLIELMIVVLVIGILAAVGIPKYQSFVMESRQKACMSQLKSIDQAIGVWETQNVAIQFNDGADMTFNPQTGFLNAAATDRRILTNRTGAWAWLQGVNVQGLLPQTDNILSIVKDGRTFVCPEVLQYYPRQDQVPNDWRSRYRFFKISGDVAQNWATDWVPRNVGRAVACFAFGYNNTNGLSAPAPWGWMIAPNGTRYAPGCGGPDRTRTTLHLQWKSQ